MYVVLRVGVHCDHFCHSDLLYRTAYRCIVGAEGYPVSAAYKYNMREIAAYFVVYQVEYPHAGVGKETAYQHECQIFDLSQGSSIVDLVLPRRRKRGIMAVLTSQYPTAAETFPKR